MCEVSASGIALFAAQAGDVVGRQSRFGNGSARRVSFERSAAVRTGAHSCWNGLSACGASQIDLHRIHTAFVAMRALVTGHNLPFAFVLCSAMYREERDPPDFVLLLQ